jgi:hypothetical protein
VFRKGDMGKYPMRTLVIEEALGSDFITALGFVALRWTSVEISTQALLGALADSDDYVGIALSAHVGDRTALDVIKSIARLRPLPDGTLESIENFVLYHGICRNNRNLVLHNRYLPSEDGIEPRIIALQRITARGNIRVINYAVEALDVYGVANECLILASVGQMLTRHINRIRGGREPSSLPPPLVLPQDLTRSLRQVDSSEFARPRSKPSGIGAWNEGKMPHD